MSFTFYAKLRRAAALAALIALCLVRAPVGAEAAFFRPDVRPGYGVTKIGWLSDYCAPLKGTNLDAPVYFMEGAKPGATMLILGGTHPREIAGHTAALVAVENARVLEGRLIVVPALNASGYGLHDKATNLPRSHKIETRSGARLLPLGDRRVDVVDQRQPDPDQYRHQSGEVIPGSKGGDGAETRNINRAYPGLPDGTPTQQVAYAVVQLVRSEDVVLEVDMHEADTPSWCLDPRTGETRQGGRLAYMLICNPRPEAMEIGAEVVVNVGDAVGFPLKIEQSNRKFRGLSHLEIGDATPCLSFLFETPNPGQDDWREVPDVIRDVRFPLKHRVGLQQQVFQELVNVYNAGHDRRLVIEGLPDYKTLMEQDVGAWLN